MAVVTDLLLTFGPYDISGETSMGEAKAPIAVSDHVCAPAPGLVGQLPLPTRVTVGRDFSVAASGYEDGRKTKTTLRASLTRADVVVAVADSRGVGEPVAFARCVRGEYTITGTVGDCWQFTFAAMLGTLNSFWDDGSQLAYADVSGTGALGGYQFGALAADERLVAGHIAERLSGTGTVVPKIVSGATGAFASPTDRITFASLGATGEEVLTLDGAVTDQHWRFEHTVTGTGVWRVRGYIAKESIA